MITKIAQISDTHLSKKNPLFDGNFPPVAEALRAARPDLVIHTGDLSLDGADCAEDLEHGVAAMRTLGLDWLAVPGNHDVGDDPALAGKQPVTAERLARWESCVGPRHFVRDIPGWRLIGLDTQGFGLESIIEALTTAGARRVAFFQHKPITEETLADRAVNYWPLLPPRRAELLALCRPAVIASGHVHEWRDRVADGIRQVWAPAIGFIVGDPWKHPVGDKVLGWVEHAFHADGTHTAELRAMPELPLHDLGSIPEAYGPLPRLG